MANRWLPWSARSSCKALQCDIQAAQALHNKAAVAAATLRRSVDILLKPERVSVLVSDWHAWDPPPVYEPMGRWLRRLHSSLRQYLEAALDLQSGIPPLPDCQTQQCLALLKECDIYPCHVAQRFLPHFHKVAGYLKICEMSIHMIDADHEDDEPEDEYIVQAVAFDTFLSQLQELLHDVQSELEMYLL